MRSSSLTAVASAVTFVVAACGGGSSPSSSSNTVTGQSYKGPTAGASICFYEIDNAAAGRKGAKVEALAGSTPSVANGCVVTGNDGTYSAVLPSGRSGDLLVESTGGTYCSDESIFDGTACAGGGTPIAMGAAKLKTVIAASGSVANAPLTLLTTAAVDAAATLDAGSFTTSYATVAANVGITNTDPSSNPAQGDLNGVLAKLATYVGGDTAVLDGVVASLAHGNLTSEGGLLGTGKTLACSPLEEADFRASFIPVLASCDKTSAGSSLAYYTINPSALLQGQVSEGQYVTMDTAATCEAMLNGTVDPESGAPTNMRTWPITVTYDGNETLARQATTNPLTAQSGAATKLTINYFAEVPPGFQLQIVAAPVPERTEKHLFCRVSETGTPIHGYLTSNKSPLKNGYFSRIDADKLYRAPMPMIPPAAVR